MKKRLGDMYSRRTGIISIIIYIGLAAAAIVFLPQLTVEGNVRGSMLPADNPFLQNSRKFYDIFPIYDASVMDVSFSDNKPFTLQNLAFVNEVTKQLEKHDAIADVYSITNIDNSELNDPDSPPFIDIESLSSIQTAEKRIHEINILHELFLSSDGDSLLLYFIPAKEASSQEFGTFIDEFKIIWKQRADIDISLKSNIYKTYNNEKFIIHDFMIVTPIALLIIFLMFYLFTFSFSASAVLFINSFIPSLIMFGGFAFFGKPIDGFTVFLPVLLFSLTTAYSIHYYKTNEALDDKPSQTLDAIGKIIIVSAFTTILGYANLMYMQIDAVQTMGAALCIGLVIAVISILFCIPSGLTFVKKGKQHTWEKRLRVGTYPLGKKAFPLIALFVMLLLVLPAGIYWYTPPWKYKDATFEILRPSAPTAQEKELFAEHNGRIEALDVFLDTKEEFGLVSLDTYRTIDRAAEKLRDLPFTATVISYTDITNYGNGLLYGRQEEIPPNSPAEIGETLELIFSYGETIPIDLFIDLNYQRTRLIIQYDISSADDGHEEVLMHEQITRIMEDAAADIEDSELFISGMPILQRELNYFFLTTLSRASILFFLTVFILGLLLLKSLRRALLLLFPSLMSLAVFFGLNGWFKLPINLYSLFGVYTLLGISIDDSIYFLMHYKKTEETEKHHSWSELIHSVYHSTGINILQTTFIITAGLTAILFSGSLSFVYTIGITLAAFNFSTFTTLYIMPRFLSYSDGKTHSNLRSNPL